MSDSREPIISATSDVDPKRSALMKRVRREDTSPEMVVRRLLHSLSYRYRLHRRDLPGSPDIVFPGRNKVIFVHGCFWHRHPGCSRTTMPKTRRNFWMDKFRKNIERDHRKLSELRAAGWSACVVWECETKDIYSLEKKLSQFLGSSIR